MLNDNEYKILTVNCAQNNLCYVIYHQPTRDALLVDATAPEPILKCLKQLGANLRSILITHEDIDHTQGWSVIKNEYPLALMLGHTAVASSLSLDYIKLDVKDDLLNPNINWPAKFLTVENLDYIKLMPQLVANILSMPGHSDGSLGFKLGRHLFSGDVIFDCGCGILNYKGNNIEDFLNLWRSLNKIKKLPPDTLIYPGHNLAAENIKFIHQTLGKNSIAQSNALAGGKNLTVPLLSLKQQCQVNPFLNCDQPDLQQKVLNLAESSGIVEIMLYLTLAKGPKNLTTLKKVPQALMLNFKQIEKSLDKSEQLMDFFTFFGLRNIKNKFS